MMQTVLEQIIYLGGAPAYFNVSSGGENSLTMKKTKLMPLKMKLRESTVTFVIKS